MPDPSTTRLQLYKSKSDGSELVNYSQDLGQNWDRVDAAVGYQVVTSSTRPSSPYPGKPITQSDTSYSTYFHNGTSPASGGWVEIPNSSAAYAGRLITLFPGSTGSSAQMRLAQTGTASGNRAFATRGSGDTADHFFFDYDGRLQWSAGGASAGDVNLYRSAINTLATDDSLSVGMNLSVAGSASFGSTTWTTYTPAVSGTGTATWTTRTGYYTKLGKIVFVCIYLVVNAAGSGTSIFTVDLPSTPDRSTRQALTMHGETIGAGGNGTGSIRGGEAVWYPSGTGATSDRLRVDAGTSNEQNVEGVDLLAAGTIVIQGWYREA